LWSKITLANHQPPAPNAMSKIASAAHQMPCQKSILRHSSERRTSRTTQGDHHLEAKMCQQVSLVAEAKCKVWGDTPMNHIVAGLICETPYLHSIKLAWNPRLYEGDTDYIIHPRFGSQQKSIEYVPWLQRVKECWHQTTASLIQRRVQQQMANCSLQRHHQCELASKSRKYC
jgi:hypothetical protein